MGAQAHGLILEEMQQSMAAAEVRAATQHSAVSIACGRLSILLDEDHRAVAGTLVHDTDRGWVQMREVFTAFHDAFVAGNYAGAASSLKVLDVHRRRLKVAPRGFTAFLVIENGSLSPGSIRQSLRANLDVLSNAFPQLKCEQGRVDRFEKLIAAKAEALFRHQDQRGWGIPFYPEAALSARISVRPFIL